MAKFSLFVTSSPFDQQGAVSALNFAQAALDAGHQLSGIFFYQSGVHNANALQSVPADEYQPYSGWLKLAQQGVNLHVCVSAAARRGVISAADAAEQGIQGNSLKPPFQASASAS